MPAGAAVVGGAIISSRASSDAADTAADSATAAGEAITDAGLRARRDALDFFPLAQQDLLSGARGGFDITSGGIQDQQRLLSEGNLNAQRTVGSGFDQVRNALLGLPVDQSSFAPQGVAQSQLPVNPFDAVNMLSSGGIGQGQVINTGQGNFNRNMLNDRFLNPLGERLDLIGAAQRGPNGENLVDFSMSQVPGSAQTVLGQGANPLQTRAFNESFAAQQRAQDRAINSGGVGPNTDRQTIGGQNINNILDALAGAVAGGSLNGTR